ncbi:arsenate reductase family protein [Gynurincola endophyticus]|uniref:arsenate reductase family protein n=1 Tax=Gynurincola endophyticus TaxID=2479004 RepID=UPI000F8EAC6F|nr:ArsC/Spx/MgsR family protein [Gynurincola endophyticus]
MKKFFHLSTCSTCKTIIKEINPAEKGFKLQDIKTEHINEQDLDQLKEIAGSYEALFNRRSQKYKSMNLKDRNLSEADYKKLILSEYTFLKRPAVIDGKKLFLGNSKELLEAYQ